MSLWQNVLRIKNHPMWRNWIVRITLDQLGYTRRMRRWRHIKQERTKLSKKLWFTVLKRDGFACKLCGRGAPYVRLQVDHILPLALGGRTVASNLQTLCEDCNAGNGMRSYR